MTEPTAPPTPGATDAQPTTAPPAYTKIQARLADESRSPLAKYQQLVVGSAGRWATLRYEMYACLAVNLGGALGLALRRMMAPRLLRSCGPGLVVGRGVTLRHPGRIELGQRVLISDGCTLDARCDEPVGIRLADDVSLGDRCALRCKDGRIDLGAGVGLGAEASVYAVAGNRIDIGHEVMIGPKAYLGGSQYHTQRHDLPIARQGHDPRGGVNVGPGAWIGAAAIILDGVRIGAHAIVAAGAVVTRDVPDYTVVAGVPARVMRNRREGSEVF